MHCAIWKSGFTSIPDISGAGSSHSEKHHCRAYVGAYTVSGLSDQDGVQPGEAFWSSQEARDDRDMQTANTQGGLWRRFRKRDLCLVLLTCYPLLSAAP